MFAHGNKGFEVPDETAVLELPGTAAGEPEAPPSFETPESAEATAPETDEQLETPESEDDADPLAALDDDALAENERVKKLLDSAIARNEESARRKAEHAANEQRRQQEAQEYQNVATNQYLGQFIGIVRSAAGDPEWMPDQSSVQQMQRFVAPFAAAARVQAKDEVVTGLNETLGEVNPNYRVPPAMLEEWNRALSSPTAVPLTKVAGLILRDAMVEKVRDEVRAEVEAELRGAQKTETGKAASAALRSAPRPAGVKAGGAPAAPDDSEILADPNASLAQKQEAYRRKYGRPYGS